MKRRFPFFGSTAQAGARWLREFCVIRGALLWFVVPNATGTTRIQLKKSKTLELTFHLRTRGSGAGISPGAPINQGSQDFGDAPATGQSIESPQAHTEVRPRRPDGCVIPQLLITITARVERSKSCHRRLPAATPMAPFRL